MPALAGPGKSGQTAQGGCEAAGTGSKPRYTCRSGKVITLRVDSSVNAVFGYLAAEARNDASR